MFSCCVATLCFFLTNVTRLYLLAATETKRCYVTTKHLNLNFPQRCNLKVYSPWRVNDHETGLSGWKCSFFPISYRHTYIYTSISWDFAISCAKLSSLADRRVQLCRHYFSKISQNRHPINFLARIWIRELWVDIMSEPFPSVRHGSRSRTNVFG